MSEEPKKKKIVFKRKADSGAKAKKPVIKLNKTPTPEEEEEEEKIPATEELPKQAPKQAKPESAPTEKTPAVKDEPAKKAEDKAFKFYCVYCGQKLSASTSITGRKISCPSCGHKIQVPEAP